MEMKKGYKHTEIGVIPEDWNILQLKNIAVLATGNTPPTNDSTNYGNIYMFVSPADLGDHKWIYNTEKKLTDKYSRLKRRAI